MQSVEVLQESIRSLQAQLAEKEIEINAHQEIISTQKTELETLHHQLMIMRQMKFGRKSEKFVDDKQGELFDEIGLVLESEDTQVNEGSEKETITYTRAKQGTKKRNELPKDLPSVTEVHDLSDEEKQCDCGCQLTHIKDETTETLDVLPQVTFKHIHIKKKYACRSCEQTIKTAPAPKSILPKTIATPGLLAAIINAKFNLHLPLYRQEEIFKTSRTPISRAVMSEWLMKLSHKIEPLIHAMQKIILGYDVAYSDETTLQVLKSQTKAPTQKSYMWLFSGGPPDKRCYLYQYHPTRKHNVVADFFDEDKFKGYLHTDCYDAYVQLDKTRDTLHQVACNAHARRNFADILKATKASKPTLAKKGIEYYKKLYAIEAELKNKNATINEIYQMRQKLAKPILDEMHKWLQEKSLVVPPKSPIGKAIQYCLKYWVALKRYIDDGRLEIDNNLSERAIKQFVIGRKNWLFHGSEKGATAGCYFYSLIQTCKVHNIDCFAYLKYIFTIIPTLSKDFNDWAALLPFNISQDKLDSMRNLPEICFPDK